MGRNTRLRLVFLPTLLSCSNRFLRALQQNRAQSRLLYLLIILHIFLINNTIIILFHHQHHLHQSHNHANHNLHKMEEGQYPDLYNIQDIQVVKGAVYFSFRGSTPSNKSLRVTSSTSSPLVCHKQAQIFVVLFSFSV